MHCLDFVLAHPYNTVVECFKGAQSLVIWIYFGHILQNKSLPMEKNSKDIIINHKETRMAKVGEDYPGFRTTNLKNLS